MGRATLFLLRKIAANNSGRKEGRKEERRGKSCLMAQRMASFLRLPLANKQSPLSHNLFLRIFGLCYFGFAFSLCSVYIFLRCRLSTHPAPT